jgi:hypothetical protein
MGSPYYLTVIDNDNGMCFVSYLLRYIRKLTPQWKMGLRDNY